MDKSILSSQLYITEATESKNKTEADLKVPDPANVTLKEILEAKHDTSTSEHERS